MQKFEMRKSLVEFFKSDQLVRLFEHDLRKELNLQNFLPWHVVVLTLVLDLDGIKCLRLKRQRHGEDPYRIRFAILAERQSIEWLAFVDGSIVVGVFGLEWILGR